MVFTVISLGLNLTSSERKRVLEAAPEFAESEQDYPTLLAQSGWNILRSDDISVVYAATCQRQVKAEQENRDDLVTIIGADEYANRQERWGSKLSVLEEGLLRRDFFVATPA